MSDQRDYPPATDDTICETCGEHGHYWCRPSRIVFKGRAVPVFHPDDFDDDAARPAPGELDGEER